MGVPVGGFSWDYWEESGFRGANFVAAQVHGEGQRSQRENSCRVAMGIKGGRDITRCGSSPPSPANDGPGGRCCAVYLPGDGF